MKDKNLYPLVIVDVAIMVTCVLLSAACGLGLAMTLGFVPMLGWSVACLWQYRREAGPMRQYHTQNFYARHAWGVELIATSALVAVSSTVWLLWNVPTVRAFLAIFVSVFLHTIWQWLWWCWSRD